MKKIGAEQAKYTVDGGVESNDRKRSVVTGRD